MGKLGRESTMPREVKDDFKEGMRVERHENKCRGFSHSK